MAVTDSQVRKLMEELTKHGVGLAAIKAGMDPKTAAKYRELGKFPSELKEHREWRTREDPFEADWPALAERLKDAPELEAKTLFEVLIAEHPERNELNLRGFNEFLKATFGDDPRFDALAEFVGWTKETLRDPVAHGRGDAVGYDQLRVFRERLFGSFLGRLIPQGK